MLTVCCWKWGTLFSPVYVNKLRAALERHLNLPHELVCVTDDARDVDTRVRIVPLPLQFINTPRCRRRMQIFSREFSTAIGERILSIDLDMVLVDDITPLVDRPEPLVCWKVGYANVYAGGFILMTPGVLDGLWRLFERDPDGYPKTVQPTGVPSDQAMLNAYLSTHRASTPVAEWTEADGLVMYFGKGYERHEHLGVGPGQPELPEGARLVALGSADLEVLETGRYDWVREHWTAVDGDARMTPATSTGPRLFTMMPYALDLNLGAAYNAAMEQLPEDAWAIFLDHDAMWTTHQWFRQIEEAVRLYPEAGLFTAVTNRIGAVWQRASEVDVNNHDIAYHRKIGQARLTGQRTLLDVTDTNGFGGVVIVLSKQAWRAAGGFVDGLFCVDHHLHFALRAAGRRIYLLEHLYVYHWRRANGDRVPITAPRAEQCPCRKRIEALPGERMPLPPLGDASTPSPAAPPRALARRTSAPRLFSCYFGEGVGSQWPRLGRVLAHSASLHCSRWHVQVEGIVPPGIAASRAEAFIANTQKLDRWLEVVRDTPDGARLLLIDADTMILQPLDAIWDEAFDLAYTVRPTTAALRYPFNSGVVFLRMSQKVRDFMEAWRTENEAQLRDPQRHDQWRRRFGGINQSAFGALLETGAAAALDLLTLPCDIWNCEDSTWRDFGPQTRIVHLKSRLRMDVFSMRETDRSLKPLVTKWRQFERELASTEATRG